MAEATAHELELSSIIADPKDNYRWGSQEAMEADWKNGNVCDQDTGEHTNTFLSLVESVRESGVIEPIRVVRSSGGKFKVVYGFNRYYAAQKAGLSSIPVTFAQEGLSPVEYQLQQLSENSSDLRRDVSWIREAMVWDRLVRSMFEVSAKLLPSKRVVDGHTLNPEKHAQHVVAVRLGITASRLNARLKLLKELPPHLIPVATENHWSVAVCKEIAFTSDGKPMSEELANFVIQGIERSGNKLRGVTAKMMRKIRMKAETRMAVGRMDWNRGRTKKAADEDVDALVAAVAASSSLSKSGVRDLAINIISADVDRLGLSLSSNDKWSAIRTTQLWYILCGMSLGSIDMEIPASYGDIVCPSSMGDLPGRSFRFAATAVVLAVLRKELKRRSLTPWPVWYRGQSAMRAGSRFNSTAFYSAGQWAVDNRKSDDLYEIAKSAFEHLRDSGCMPTLTC